MRLKSSRPGPVTPCCQVALGARTPPGSRALSKHPFLFCFVFWISCRKKISHASLELPRNQKVEIPLLNVVLFPRICLRAQAAGMGHPVVWSYVPFDERPLRRSRHRRSLPHKVDISYKVEAFSRCLFRYTLRKLVSLRSSAILPLPPFGKMAELRYSRCIRKLSQTLANFEVREAKNVGRKDMKRFKPRELALDIQSYASSAHCRSSGYQPLTSGSPNWLVQPHETSEEIGPGVLHGKSFTVQVTSPSHNAPTLGFFVKKSFMKPISQEAITSMLSTKHKQSLLHA